MEERALAIDLGSSSVRAIVFQKDGNGTLQTVPGALSRRPRHMSTAEPGQATFDAEGYFADLVACIDELEAAGCLESISTVAVDSQWHSIVPIDSSGSPIGQALSWADTRPRHPLTELKDARMPAEEARFEDLRQRTGCAFAPLYWTWRAPWLVAQAGGSSIARFVGLPELVGQQLLDDPSTSLSMASGTGLLATAEQQWDDEALRLAGITAAMLPPLAPPGWRGRLSPTWRRRWPGLAGADWSPVVGDGAAANVGVGCDRPGQAAMTIGTSAAVRAIRPAPDRSQLAPNLWRYCLDAERVVVGAAFSSGGQLYAWALSLWEGTSTAATGALVDGAGMARGVSHEVRYDLPLDIAAGSEGVLVLPWHAGTRPPAPSVPGGQGCIVGLGLGHTGAHIVSAAVEAVCFQLAQGLADLEQDGEKALEIVANGGAIDRSPWWKARLASVLGRPLHCPMVQETTALGAAALALGVELSASSMEDELVAPVEEDVKELARARARWASWYDKLLPIARAAGE